MRCNICGGTTFEAFRGRANERCAGCGAKARHRVALDIYERLLFPLAGDGAHILHLAPEECLVPVLRETFRDGYVTADADPDRYPWADARRLVLPDQFDAFPPAHFDAILHNHVLEHIPGHYRDHLAGLVDWLKPGGLMIFSVPGPYLDRMTREGGEHFRTDAERIELFRQADHFKRFGRDFVKHVETMAGGRRLDDGVTDARRAELAVRPGKAPFFVWRRNEE
ncbi:MAG: hypothetical protein BroJett030_14550 [Alphaproteobacteria bacterium]|nr:MAG: hypothetical protein BroJett030_14550 [Alphaproteobacteria bacterium]